MLTDSRSFLSYPRHEYFRRILCNLLGNDVENDYSPASEIEFIGKMVEDVSYNIYLPETEPSIFISIAFYFCSSKAPVGFSIFIFYKFFRYYIHSLGSFP